MSTMRLRITITMARLTGTRTRTSERRPPKRAPTESARETNRHQAEHLRAPRLRVRHECSRHTSTPHTVHPFILSQMCAWRRSHELQPVRRSKADRPTMTLRAWPPVPYPAHTPHPGRTPRRRHPPCSGRDGRAAGPRHSPRRSWRTADAFCPSPRVSLWGAARRLAQLPADSRHGLPADGLVSCVCVM
jgi:hypothetical protein